jgi:hypothetical protein
MNLPLKINTIPQKQSRHNASLIAHERMHGSSNQGYMKSACALTEIRSAPATACQSTTEILAAQEYLPVHKVYWNTGSDRPWSGFLEDAK